MDEVRAQIEEVLQRGEQILHQPMEDSKKEKIRLQLLLLHTRYNKMKVFVTSVIDSAVGILMFCIIFMTIANRWK